MRCLVTGASGHLGSRLVQRLIEGGQEVVSLVRPQSDLWRLREVIDRIRIVRGDLSDYSSVGNQILEGAPEVVFHLAWHGVTREERSAPDQTEISVRGCLDLFEMVRTAGCRIWIGMGSQAEYGSLPAGPVKEDFPPRPTSAYGNAKLRVGFLTQKLCETANTRYVWFRLFAAYGPRDNESRLIPMAIRSLLAKEMPQLTQGRQKWDYLYVDDTAEALYQAAVNSDVKGVYNLGSGHAFPIRKVVEIMRDAIDPSLPLGFGEIPYRPDEIMHLQADISKFQRVTDWSPQVKLKEGLRRTIDWYRTHEPHESLRVRR